MSDAVDHPDHYGGEDNPYEVIKVAEAWGFDKDAYLFNVLKYIGRPAKGDYLEDLKKARFYLNRKINNLEQFKFPDAQVTEMPAKPYQFPLPHTLKSKIHEVHGGPKDCWCGAHGVPLDERGGYGGAGHEEDVHVVSKPAAIIVGPGGAGTGRSGERGYD